MSVYLQRHYQVYVSPTTILKIFHRHHVGRVSLKRYRSGPKRQVEGPLPVPGQSVQVDVKFVPRVGRARQWFCQFTAIDEATRYRVLPVYDYNNTRSAVAFLDEVRRRLPFAIQRIQTDNDSSFGPQFTWHLADLGIAHRHIPPPVPKSTVRLSGATRPMRKISMEGSSSEVGSSSHANSGNGRRSTTSNGHISHLGARRQPSEAKNSLGHPNL